MTLLMQCDEEEMEENEELKLKLLRWQGKGRWADILGTSDTAYLNEFIAADHLNKNEQ